MRREQDMGDEIDRLRAENEQLRADTRNIQRNTAVYRQEARAEVDKANRRASDAIKRADDMAAANRALLSAFEQNPHPAAPQAEEANVLPDNLAELIEQELNAWRGANGGVYTIHAAALGVSIKIRAAMFRAALAPAAIVSGREGAEVEQGRDTSYGRECTLRPGYFEDDME